MSSKSRQQLEEWIKNKEVSGYVLDVGGSQLPIEARIKMKDKTYFDILDLPNPHEVRKMPVFEFDLNQDLIDLDEEYLGTYDYAVCLEVSEYWWDPVEAITGIRRFLKKGGTLFISFHFIYPVHNPVSEDCMRYTRNGAIKLLESCGFKIVEAVGRTADLGLLRNLYHGEGMRPAKEYPDHDEVGLLVEAIKI